MKILDGRELAGFIKERQRQVVMEMVNAGRPRPKLVIIRNNNTPVIKKYVELKKQYGEDIGVMVEDARVRDEAEMRERMAVANKDVKVSGIIVQLPMQLGDVDAAEQKRKLDEILGLIAPEKDVDGLSGKSQFDSATATAINWLLSSYDVKLAKAKLAIVGRGRLVGAPLYQMWQNSGLDVSLFHRGDDLSKLSNFDVIVSATGQAGLIKNNMVRGGAVVVDAGTANEGGVLVGDVAEEVRERKDLGGITPKVGGVGPLTVACLFEQVIRAAR